MSNIFYDLHTHTRYSHGLGSIGDSAKTAVRRGLNLLGISDHGPGHMLYGMDMAKLPAMREDINKAKKNYPGLNILLGVEANIANISGELDVSKEQQKMFDYIIAGYHYAYFGSNLLNGLSMCVGGWLYEKGAGTGRFRRAKNTDIIIAALENNDIRIITHPGEKMPIYIDAVAKCCERRSVIMEINSHHSHLSADEIRLASEYDVKFILSSDAHNPQSVGCVEEAFRRAQAAGLDESRIVNLKEGFPWNL